MAEPDDTIFRDAQARLIQRLQEEKRLASARSPSPSIEQRNREDLPTRDSLLSRLRHDTSDEKSWTEFYYTYWKLIFGTARRHGLSSVEAEEVVQDTLLALLRKLPQFHYDRKKGSFRNWLMNQTRWKVLDHLKRRRASSELDVAPQSETCNEFEELWTEEWEQTVLKIAFDRVSARLTPHLVQIYAYCVSEEKGVPETARTFGISRAAVYMAVHKVKRQIKKEIWKLEKEGI